MAWGRDVAFGEHWEQFIIEYFNYTSVRKMNGKFGAFDYICVKEGGHSIVLREIKADRISKRTGNLVIEFLSKGKESGIYTTHADYWTYCVIGEHDELDVYDIPVWFLKRGIQEQAFCEIKMGGDDSAMFVFKSSFFDAYKLDLNQPYTGP